MFLKNGSIGSHTYSTKFFKSQTDFDVSVTFVICDLEYKSIKWLIGETIFLYNLIEIVNILYSM